MSLKVGGFTIEDKSKDYNVYLNYLRSDEQKKATLEHELNHIRGGDFNRKDVPVEVIEAQCRARDSAEMEIKDTILYLGYCELPDEKNR